MVRREGRLRDTIGQGTPLARGQGSSWYRLGQGTGKVRLQGRSGDIRQVRSWSWEMVSQGTPLVRVQDRSKDTIGWGTG